MLVEVDHCITYCSEPVLLSTSLHDVNRISQLSEFKINYLIIIWGFTFTEKRDRDKCARTCQATFLAYGGWLQHPEY